MNTIIYYIRTMPYLFNLLRKCIHRKLCKLLGVRHSIDAADGTSALFSNKLESLLDEAKASGKKFQLDQSKLKIRGYHNLDTNATGFMAYYNSKADSEDFAL